MSGEQFDSPNQQAVRPDGSGPADEGAGGSAGAPAADGDELDSMTKDQLLEEAASMGITVTSGMTKDEIKAVIRAG